MTIPAIHHDAAQSRFATSTDAGEAVLEYIRDGQRITFTHTGVPPEAEGRGVGSALAMAGLDYARSEGLRVRPTCPFVAAFVKDHAEYQDLIDAR